MPDCLKNQPKHRGAHAADSNPVRATESAQRKTGITPKQN